MNSLRHKARYVRAYHLTKAEHAPSNLRHRRLKIATFDDLNDPFELWAVARPNAQLRKGLRRWKEQIARLYGVLCFSRTWSNPVLWSHYADRHRGIALGFDISTEIVKAVTYATRRPRFHQPDLPTLHTLLYTNHRDWKYEQEVRVFASLQERDPTTKFYFGEFSADMAPREVITGPLCTTTRAEIEQSLQDQPAVIIKGRLAFNSFKVVANKRGFR